MMTRLACSNCGTPLTLVGEWGTPQQWDINVGNGASPVPAGLLIRMAEDRVPVFRSGEQIGTHLYSPEGAIAVDPAMVPEDALHSVGIDNGCCGSDGCDGPNRACGCGAPVATQWSDCWTLAEIRFLPDAVVEID